LNSRIANKASTLFLCLFGPVGRVVKAFASLAVAPSQRRHNYIRPSYIDLVI
jgi:hypothetical protein